MTPRPSWARFRSDDGRNQASEAADMADAAETRVDRGPERQEAGTGGLMGTVEVRVYEDRAEVRVTFPDQSSVPDIDPSRIADVVARARGELEGWT